MLIEADKMLTRVNNFDFVGSKGGSNFINRKGELFFLVRLLAKKKQMR